MKRFHLTEDGRVGPCEANIRSCPIGGPNVHFPSEDAARQAFELSMAGETFSELRKPRSPFSGSMEENLNRAKDDLVGSYALFQDDPAERFQEQVVVMSYVAPADDKLVLVYPKSDAIQWDESLKTHLAKSALTTLAMRTCDEAGVGYDNVVIEGFSETDAGLELTVSAKTSEPATAPPVPVSPLTSEKVVKIECTMSDKLNVANQSIAVFEKKSRAPIFDQFDAEVSHHANERIGFLSSQAAAYRSLKDITKDDRDPRILRDKAIALLPSEPDAAKTSDQYQRWQAKYQAISQFLQELSPADHKSSLFIAAEPKKISWFYED